MKLHERLRELRTERGLRLKDVAELTSLSASWVCDLERGRLLPSIGSLKAFAAAYGITVQDILHGSEMDERGDLFMVPRALAELQADPVLGSHLTSDWVKTLARIERNGKRPRTKGEYYEIFLHLRRILAPEEARG